MDHGLPIKSTTSNEAIKLYDCALTQYVGWYDDPQEDHGLGGTLGRMNESDPNFSMFCNNVNKTISKRFKF